LHWKDTISSFYGNWLHEGLIMDPVMRDIEAFLESSQQRVTGSVLLRLHPYRFTVVGVESPYDLMQSSFGAYGEEQGTWTGEDVKGFTRIFGLQNKIYHQTKKRP
ncbi:MAG TPA: argininosuccinate synthase, partial [Bacteroidetes bacterium]|nr:argininosuccinate synthase [Bacteroidota bacterium]